MRMTITSVTEWDVSESELENLRGFIFDECEDREIPIDGRMLPSRVLLREIAKYVQEVDPFNWEQMDGIQMDEYYRTISFFEGEDTTDLVCQIVDHL